MIESAYRYERKIWITNLSYFEVEGMLKIHPYLFSEIYHKRTINNIYFDTINYSNFHDNIDGLANRIKVRVRWYGDLLGKVKNPVLEIKLKKGLAGKKISYPIPPFSLEYGKAIPDILSGIAMEDIPFVDLKLLRATLINQYDRKYFQSANKKFRFTIDSEQHFYEPGNDKCYFAKHERDNDSTILELKYSPSDDEEAVRIMSYFPFRITKSSKYVTGIQRLNQLMV